MADLQWMVGSWIDGPHGEHWRAVGGVLFGIGFRVEGDHTSMFDVMLVEQSDAIQGELASVRLVAMPNGGAEVVFPLVEHGGDGTRRWAIFENLTHDDPIRIRYERTRGTEGDLLRAEVTSRTRAVTAFTWRLDTNPSCVSSGAASTNPGTSAVTTGPAREAARAARDADLDFARITAETGVDGWVSYFLGDGAMWDRRARQHLSGEAIRAAMAPLFASGRRLRWAPSVVCSASAGDTAFSVGTSRVESPPEADGTRSVERKGAYVTVWQRSAETSKPWRVRFDTGI